MSKVLDVFHEIPCLTERSSRLLGVSLQKKWFKVADKRIIGQYLQKFIAYNAELFEFLGVEPFIVGTDKQVALTFRSTGFIGAIPLRSPDTGKQIGDFVVNPRFLGSNRFADYIDILNLLEADISPKCIDSLPLVSGRNFKPPAYLEATKFITCLEALLKQPWRKFDVVEKLSSQPTGQVSWDKYCRESFKIEKRLSFPTKSNILTERHPEYAQMRYVFDVCKAELFSSRTPKNVQHSLRSRLMSIENKLYQLKPQYVKKMMITARDTHVIRQCKQQGNRVLQQNWINSTAWRVDMADVFEKFTQYVFKRAAKEMGAVLWENSRFKARHSKYYGWALQHIEPDAVYQKDNELMFIDAKYKSNLYNSQSQSRALKEDHRRDLHQIMAYSSFSKTAMKYSFLCYPTNHLSLEMMRYQSPINEVNNTIFVLGLPLVINRIDEAKALIIQAIKNHTPTPSEKNHA